MTVKSEIEQAIKVKAPDNLEERLKKEFQKVMDNPTDERIKKYNDLENAILSLWASKMFKDLSERLNEVTDLGRETAVEQLKKKGFKKSAPTPDIYKSIRNNAKTELKQTLQRLTAMIKLNSSRNIASMQDAFILQKKSLNADFIETFRKYGVTYFTDKSNRRWTVTRYTDMLSTTLLADAERKAFFASSLEYGNDLVKVIHLGVTPECDFCAPFTGKVLSITGKTKGYMSVDIASQTGHLFGVNCDHVTAAFELAPKKEDEDNLIPITEKNLKALEKNGIDTKKLTEKEFIKTTS